MKSVIIENHWSKKSASKSKSWYNMRNKEIENIILKSSTRAFRKKMYGKNPEYSKGNFFSYWYKLIDHLEARTNRLVSWEGKKSYPINQKQILDIIGKKDKPVSRSTLQRFLKESYEKGYMRKSSILYGAVAYYMNPAYVLNGDGVTVELYLIFEGEKVFESLLSQTEKDKIFNYLKGDSVEKIELQKIS